MISVIITVYNSENTIRRCLDSVINQTYKDIEIIAINDGSLDNSLILLQEYVKRDNRIVVINQENMGVSAARNVGLSNAKGDFILFIDSDDWIELDMIDRMFQIFKDNQDCDIVFCGHDNADEPSKIVIEKDIMYEKWDNKKQIIEFMKHKQMTGMLWNKLIRKDLIGGTKFNEKIFYGEDADFLWEILKKTNILIKTNEIFYHHVLDKSSITHQNFSDKKYTAIYVWLNIFKDINKNYCFLKRYAIERLLSVVTYTYYEIKKSKYNNTEKKENIRKIIKKYLFNFLMFRNVSLKMKLYAILIYFKIV